MGMLDSGLPVVVFVVVNVVAGLGWAIGAALGAGVLIATIRLVRHRPVTQAISGLIGVGVAAFIAYKLGSARGYFLVGIWTRAALRRGLVGFRADPLAAGRRRVGGAQRQGNRLARATAGSAAGTTSQR